MVVGSLTEDVYITKFIRDFFQKRSDLIFVRNIKSDGDETPALLDACCLVCGSTLLRYVLQGITSACGEDDIRTTLSNEYLNMIDKVDKLPTLANRTAVAFPVVNDDRDELMVVPF